MNRNIAIVGCGYWGRNLVRNFAELDALHTICDADPKVLKQYESCYSGIQRESEYSRILHNEEIKGVVIATPAALHYSTAKQALLADKDVFVEKPIATSGGDAQELLALAEERQRVLMVGHLLLLSSYRFSFIQSIVLINPSLKEVSGW
ncbi:Gfo/Idh/MocA family protein [Chloroflexota bacterium]